MCGGAGAGYETDCSTEKLSLVLEGVSALPGQTSVDGTAKVSIRRFIEMNAYLSSESEQQAYETECRMGLSAEQRRQELPLRRRLRPQDFNFKR